MTATLLARGAAALLLSAALSACGSTNPPLAPATTPAEAGAFALHDHMGRAVAHTHVMLPREATVPFAEMPMAQGPALYHNGTVQTTPAIYVVYWGFTTDPDGEAARLTAFYRGVGASQWLSDVTQYYQKGPVHISSPASQLKGVWNDLTDPVPAHPTDGQVQAEAVRLAVHFNANNRNAAYIVATPTQHSTNGFKKDFCAYHGNTYSHGGIAYVDFPYQSDAGYACGANAVHQGAAGRIDGVTIVGGHELSEAQTDPSGGGWYDAGGNEIADKCAWRDMRSESFGSAGSFATQPLWSNANSACVQ